MSEARSVPGQPDATAFDSSPFFTIESPYSAGIADTLLNHFSVPYAIGHLCGFRYLHRPLSFARSLTSHRKRRAQRLVVECFLRLGLLTPLRLARSLGRPRGAPGAVNATCPLTRFLGLEQVSPSTHPLPPDRAAAVDVDLPSLFDPAPPQTPDELRRSILREKPGSGGTPMIRFRLGSGLYQALPAMRDFIQSCDPGAIPKAHRLLHDCYWNHGNRTPAPDHDPIRIVVHVRRGDRAIVPLPQRTLYLHGRRVFDSENALYETIPAVERYTRFIDAGAFAEALRHTLRAIGDLPAEVTIVTDGHARTLFNVVDAHAHREIRLSRSEIRALRRLAAEWTREIDALDVDGIRTRRLVGESVETTLASIEAIVGADVVIHGSGGFAPALHRLYRPDPDSLIVHAGFVDEATAKNIRAWGERRRAKNTSLTNGLTAVHPRQHRR